MGEGFPWESHEKCPMGWGRAHCVSHGTYGTEIDEHEIEKLLNEHFDSEYQRQNNNKLLTLMNFKVNKVNIFCRFVSLFVQYL